MDVLERKLLLLEQRGWFEDVAKRRDALDRILPTLRAASDPMIRDLYIGRVAERVGISRETLEREVAGEGGARSRDRTSRRSGDPTGERPAPTRATVVPFGAKTEEKLLRVLLASPSWRTRAATELRPEDFELPAFRAVFEALVALPADADIDQVRANLDEAYLPTFQAPARRGGRTGSARPRS